MTKSDKNSQDVVAEAPAKPKHPGGRPSKYKPEFCERVLEMAAEGMSMAEYAAEFGIDRTTLFDWRDRHPEFSTALARAKILEQSWWECQARLNVKNKDFNANLWYRCAASRFRDDYTERKSTELTGPGGGAVQVESRTLDINNLSHEEMIALRNLTLKLKAPEQ